MSRYADALVPLALLAAGVYLNALSRRPPTPSWHSLLTRRRRARTFSLLSVLFITSSLTIVYVNLYRALLPQAGPNTPWIFALLTLPPPVIFLTSAWRRLRRTGSRSS